MAASESSPSYHRPAWRRPLRGLRRAGALLGALLFAAAQLAAAEDAAAFKGFIPAAAEAKALLAGSAGSDDAGKAAGDAPREIAPGWSVTGSLGPASDLGSPATDAWTLVATPGAAVTVELGEDSAGLDLAALDPDSREVLGRAFAGSGTVAVSFAMPPSGRARIVVLDLAGSGAQTTYRLLAREGGGSGGGSTGGSTGGGTGGSTGGGSGGTAAPLSNFAEELLGRVRELRPGERASGRLEAGDARHPGDDSYVDGYRVVAAPGARLEAFLASRDFDAYLLVIDGDGNVLARNDDASGTDARVLFDMPDYGPAYVVANSVSPGETGAYTVSLDDATGVSADLGDGHFERRLPIFVGRTIEAELSEDDARHPSDGAPMDVYALSLGAGETVTIEARSRAIDTYLLLLSADGSERLRENDDGGEGTNSRLFYTAPDAREVLVVVRPYERNERGPYTLSVSAGAPEPEDPEGDAIAHFLRLARPLPGSGIVDSVLDYDDERLPSDGTPIEVYRFTAGDRERVSILMTSGDFDTYLHLVAPDLGLVLTRDDDSGGGTDSRIDFTLPGAGDYLIVANGYDETDTGRYRLELTRSSVLQTSTDPRRALLVGINDYGGSSDLTAPVQDALEMRDVLVNVYGYAPENVELLLDQQATRGGVVEAISRHLGAVGPDGTALFFYSGHGMQIDGYPSRDAGETDQIDEALYLAGDTMLLDDELAALTSTLPASRIAVILDSCYSGGNFRSITGIPKGLTEDDLDTPVERPARRLDAKTGPSRASPDRVLLELAASREDQLSWQFSRWPGRSEPLSVFTYYLLEMLRDAARAPEAGSFAADFRRLGEQTTALTQREFGQRQDPFVTPDAESAELVEFLLPRRD